MQPWDCKCTALFDAVFWFPIGSRLEQVGSRLVQVRTGFRTVRNNYQNTPKSTIMLNRLIKILTVIRLLQSIWWDGVNLLDHILNHVVFLLCLALLSWAFVVIFF